MPSENNKNKGEQKVTIQSLLDDNIKLMHKNSDLNEELDAIKKYYEIEIIENEKSYAFRSPKVDSALQLLKVYSDKIKYEPTKNSGRYIAQTLILYK